MRRGLLVSVAAAVTAALLPATASASPEAAPAAPRLDWGACAPDSAAAQAGDFQCATAQVPLSYDDPGGRTITLSLVRRPATDPSTRLGTLFVNPGGPGGMGTVQVPAWIGLLPQGLQERFDVVSWDPRGVGESTGVQCFDSQEAEAQFLGEYADFPVGDEQEQAYTERWQELGRRCAERDADLLAHVSTADTARDLDLLRRAVGDEALTYLGLSYGTFLGATYANLFPDRVRALVLDGNLAPGNWTNDGRPDATENLAARIGSEAGMAAVLQDVLTLCGSTDVQHCPFSAGSPQATTDKFDALLARLQQGPIATDDRTYTYAGLLGSLANALDIVTPFDSAVDRGGSTGWTGLSVALEEIWQAKDAPVPTAADKDH
jgi:pimeloyl-ACP methyl ester carboxylesterase